MKKNDNDKIKCDVESCKYNDGEDCCELESIEVSCTCDNCDCTDSAETVCKSFECNTEKCESYEDDDEDTNITDNEYEVQSESDEDEGDYNEEEDN